MSIRSKGLRDARAHLKAGGIISLSFSIINTELGRKIYLMMQQAFDGHPPVCIKTDYDGSTIFLEAKDKDLSLPNQLLQQTGFHDQTALFADPTLRADVSTDDWPFFYMPRRVYPLSYLVMVVLIVLLSFLVTVNFVAERPQFSHLPFFFLGAGFMLVETKGITELGLTFGNSWQVIGVIIVGLLLMAFLGNCIVQWLRIRRPSVPYLLLFASLGLGWLIARNGGLPSSPFGRLETALLLTIPMLFSGIVFSTLLGEAARYPASWRSTCWVPCPAVARIQFDVFGVQGTVLDRDGPLCGRICLGSPAAAGEGSHTQVAVPDLRRWRSNAAWDRRQFHCVTRAGMARTGGAGPKGDACVAPTRGITALRGR